MMITLNQINHNPEYTNEPPYVAEVDVLKYGKIQGVCILSTPKTLNIITLTPYHSAYDKQHVIDLLNQWHSDGCVVPPNVVFEQNQLKYLLVPISKVRHITSILGIDGPVYSYQQALNTKKQLKITAGQDIH